MSEPTREIFIDDRIESYGNYVPDEWAPKVYELAKRAAVLDELLFDLILGWRTTAYTAQGPATAVKTAQATTLGYARYQSPDSSIVSYSEQISAALSRKVPELVEDRRLRERLMSELVIVSDVFRNRVASVDPQMPIEPMWLDFLKEDAFRLA